jgi:hypothetical protein
MIRHKQQSADSDKRSLESLEKKKRRQQGGEDSEDCRCKEVSKKTFPQLLKVMIGDLAFWKKAKEPK